MHSGLAGIECGGWSLCGGGEFRLDNQWFKGLVLSQQNSARSRFPAAFTHVWP